MVRGFAVRVKPAMGLRRGKRTAKGTLPFRYLWLADVGQEAGMRRTNLSEVVAGLSQAQLAVHGQTDFGRVGVLLAVIFPPADGAKTHCVGCLQRLVSAAGTAKARCNINLHGKIDDKTSFEDYAGRYA